MTRERLDGLRSEVARHAGPARARPLTELGRELANEFWRHRPGRPSASEFLDEAIEVLQEAHGHLEPGRAPRARAAFAAGWLLGTRNTVHDGAGGPADRDRGIALLDESLAGPFLDPVPRVLSRVVLGRLLMSPSLRWLVGGGFDVPTLLSGIPARDAADLERATECLRQVGADPEAPAVAAEEAGSMLETAEMLRDLTGGGGDPGGPDFGRTMSAMAAMRGVRQRAAAHRAGSGFALRPDVVAYVADEMARADPPERPVRSVIGAGPAPGPSPATSPPVAAAELRRAFHAALPDGSVRALLEPGAPVLDADTVDRLVARSAALVAADDAEDGDHVLHAVALYRRGLGDGRGDGTVPGDLRAAADELVAARLARARADAVADAVRLADRLAEHGPALAVTDRLGEWFSDVGGALRGAGVDGLLYPGPGRWLFYDVAGGGFGVADLERLPGRVLVVGDHLPPPTESALSVVRTARQAAELARRRRRAPGDAAVFVGNPRRDRGQASIETMLLRRTFYPRSVGLGQTVEDSDGDGTPAEVRARLDASMLHLACGLTESGDLELAGPAVLGAAEIAAATGAGDGGVAILPPSPRGAAPLVDALLTAGYSGAVAFRSDLPGEVASLVYVLLHSELVDRGLDPANAVARVRRWLRDPQRVLPDYLPSWYRSTATGSDVAVAADALVHHGV